MSKSESAPPLDKDQLRSLLERSDASGLLKLFQHGMAIALVVILLAVFDNGAVQGLLIITLGVLLTFLFAPLHETIHKTAFDSPLLNEVVAWVSGLVLILPPKYFQAFHMAHHRHTQVVGKDPELDVEKPESWGQYLRNLAGVDYWMGQIKVLVLFAVGHHHPHFVSAVKRPGIVKEARIFLLVYILLLCFSLVGHADVLWKYWVLPMLIGQPLLRAFLLAEHSLCPHVPDMLKNTRTTLTNKWARWICWNMSFHAEHHAYPAIPFHRLPHAHTLLAPHIDVICHGYVNLHKEITRTF